MKTKLFIVGLLATTLSFSSVSLAQNTNSQGANFGATDTATGTASGSAKSGSGQQAMGAAMNGGMAAVMAGIGYSIVSQPDPNPTKPMGYFMIAQSVMGFGQMAMQLATSGANGDKANTFSNNYGSGLNNYSNTTGGTSSTLTNGGDNSSAGTTSAGNTTNTNGNSTNGPGDSPNGIAGNDPNALAALRNLSPDAKEALAKLTAAGYKMDISKGTVTLPDGTTITPSDVSNPSAFESKLGLAPGTSAKYRDMAQEIAKKYQADHPGMGGAGDSSLAGGAGGADAYGGSAEKDGPGGKYNPNKNGAKPGDAGRLPASALVAGLTSKYNGENIGVAADNIFTMVQRRYQLKKDQDAFIISEQPDNSPFAPTPKN